MPFSLPARISERTRSSVLWGALVVCFVASCAISLQSKDLGLTAIELYAED